MKSKFSVLCFLIIYSAIVMAFCMCTASAETVNYPVTGGQLVFDTTTGSITGFNGSPTSIVIPNSISGISVKSIEYGAFYYCTSLTSITIPNSVTSIGSQAFQGCDGLTNLTIPSSITSIGDFVLIECHNLKSITIDPNNPYYSSVAGVLFNKNITSLIQFPAGLGGAYCIPNSVTSIGNLAFSECYTLSSITIPSSVTSIGYNAFSQCNTLSSITIPSSVTSIGCNAFEHCFNLTSITIPSSVTSISNYLFTNCSNLTSITIPEGVTFIGEGAFMGCEKLTNMTIPNSVTSISNDLFKYCSNLTSITIPEGVTFIGESAFMNCGELTNLTIPSSVTSIGEYAFEHCSRITSIILPNSVTNIGNSAFSECANLINITLSSSITNINNNTFYKCSKLTTIIIPNNVINIGDNAFYNCTSLSRITMPTNLISIGQQAFYACITLNSITIPSKVARINDSAFRFCGNLGIAYFNGNAPTLGAGVFEYTPENFYIEYTYGASGFTTPYWHGHSCICDPSTIKTAPKPPTNVTATAGNGQATINFTVPTSNGGSPITAYTVTSYPGNINATGTSSPITVTGLINGTSYTFTVTATNAIGTSVASTSLLAVIPKGVPVPPTNVTATAENGQATINFTVPTSNGGSPITAYTVTSYPGNINATGTSSPITVTGLINGTSYTFTVTATNAIGTSVASTSSLAVIPKGPPGAPTNVTAALGNTQATVSFRPPSSNGGSPITEYTVTSYPGNIKATGVSSPIILTGLINGTSYTFSVTATNAVGVGAASISSNPITPQTLPDAPTNITVTCGNGVATVSFTAPVSNGGGTIFKYTVTSNPENITATGSSSPIVVTGLTNGITYTFTVTATNTAGTGAASSPSAPVTPKTIPGAPTEVTAISGNGQATVSFIAPTSNGGSQITGFTVTSNPGNKTATGISSPIIITGLTNGTAYTFTVKATNSVGTGISSSPSLAVIPKSIPGTPTNVTATAGVDKATVNFTAPTSNGGSPISGYAVTANPGNITTIGTSSPITLTGLTNGTTYIFTVTATNEAGTGAASTPSAPVTIPIDYAVSGGAIAFDVATGKIIGFINNPNNVVIPNSINGVKVTSIDNNAFYGCNSLTSISIPDSVTSIGSNAFYGCVNLTTAYFNGNAPSMGTSVFNGSAIGFTIYYNITSTGYTSPIWEGYQTLMNPLPIQGENTTLISNYRYSTTNPLPMFQVSNASTTKVTINVTSVAGKAVTSTPVGVLVSNGKWIWPSTLIEDISPLCFTVTESWMFGSYSPIANVTLIYTQTNPANDASSLVLPFAIGDDSNSITQNISLPLVGASGSPISWETSDNTLISNKGVIYRKLNDNPVTLTATIGNGSGSVTKQFNIIIKGLINTSNVSFTANSIAITKLQTGNITCSINAKNETGSVITPRLIASVYKTENGKRRLVSTTISKEDISTIGISQTKTISNSVNITDPNCTIKAFMIQDTLNLNPVCIPIVLDTDGIK